MDEDGCNLLNLLAACLGEKPWTLGEQHKFNLSMDLYTQKDSIHCRCTFDAFFDMIICAKLPGRKSTTLHKFTKNLTLQKQAVLRIGVRFEVNILSDNMHFFGQHLATHSLRMHFDAC